MVPSKELTVVIANFMREENLQRILDALQSQTVQPAAIWIWDNSPGQSFAHESAEVYRSGENLKCSVRWSLARMAQTPYILVMDDDLLPTANDVLALTLCALDRYEGRAIGAVGVKLRDGKSYADSSHVGFGRRGRYAMPIAQDTEVDIVKGRYFAVAKERLHELAGIPDYEDDIAVSAHVGGGVVLSDLQSRFIDLPQGRESVSFRREHMRAREDARQKFFPVSAADH